MQYFKVPSFSSPGTTYILSWDEEHDDWKCNCHDFVMNKKSKEYCKHILTIRKLEEKRKMQVNAQGRYIDIPLDDKTPLKSHSGGDQSHNKRGTE
jgi:hypothetical protein